MASQDHPKPLPPSHPQLPQHVWKRFRKEFPESIIFSSAFSVPRHGLATGEIAADSSEFISHFIPKADGMEQLVNLDPSWLHLAVLHGDIPLACEALRLGTPIHSKERRGFTAVYFGCAWVQNYVRHGKWKVRAAGSYPVPERQVSLLMKTYSKMLQVCIFLIEQHSDPNETHNGTSLLHLACVIGNWDLIRVLLLHGAKPSNTKIHPVNMFDTPSDKARFTALVSQYSTHAIPPRPCPCACGRPLSECHATEQPYPGEQLCPCCSRKTYAKCCQKRLAFTWHEKWTDETQFHFVKKVVYPMHFADPEEQADFVAKLQSTSEVDKRDLLPTPDGVRDSIQLSHCLIQCLALNGKVDRAFAEAAEKTGYLPRPGWIDTTSKIDGKELVSKWNQAVDDYIASGVDSCGRKIIENAAKIGITGGPLFRTCEAEGCASVEGRDSIKLLLCSGCKTAVYCSKTCQKNAWNSHKSACRSGTVKIQALPSQLAYFEVIASQTGMDLSSTRKSLEAAREFFGRN